VAGVTLPLFSLVEAIVFFKVAAEDGVSLGVLLKKLSNEFEGAGVDFLDEAVLPVLDFADALKALPAKEAGVTEAFDVFGATLGVFEAVSLGVAVSVYTYQINFCVS
jgi:hypothetical protein